MRGLNRNVPKLDSTELAWWFVTLVMFDVVLLGIFGMNGLVSIIMNFVACFGSYAAVLLVKHWREHHAPH